MKKRMFCSHCGSTELSVFFPTPHDIAEIAIEQARIESPAMTVLEPSAGDGSIARLAAATGANVDCVEIQGHMCDELRATGLYRNVFHGDFLTRAPSDVYERIVMNPPFENGSDMDHVEHALRFLAPGGLLVAVITSMTGERKRRKDTAFATLLQRHHATRSSLPNGSFKAVGTNVSCDLVVLQHESH